MDVGFTTTELVHVYESEGRLTQLGGVLVRRPCLVCCDVIGSIPRGSLKFSMATAYVCPSMKTLFGGENGPPLSPHLQPVSSTLVHFRLFPPLSTLFPPTRNPNFTVFLFCYSLAVFSVTHLAQNFSQFLCWRGLIFSPVVTFKKSPSYALCLDVLNIMLIFAGPIYLFFTHSFKIARLHNKVRVPEFVNKKFLTGWLFKSKFPCGIF